MLRFCLCSFHHTSKNQIILKSLRNLKGGKIFFKKVLQLHFNCLRFKDIYVQASSFLLHLPVMQVFWI